MNDVKMVARVLKADLSDALNARSESMEGTKVWCGTEAALKAQIANPNKGYTDRGVELPRNWSNRIEAEEAARCLAEARNHSQEVRDLTHGILETADGSVFYVDVDAIRDTVDGLHALRGRHDQTVRRLRDSREDRATEESEAIRRASQVTPVLVLAIAAAVAIHGGDAFEGREFDPTEALKA